MTKRKRTCIQTEIDIVEESIQDCINKRDDLHRTTPIMDIVKPEIQAEFKKLEYKLKSLQNQKRMLEEEYQSTGVFSFLDV